MKTQATTFRIGKCRWCGEAGEVYRDNRLCEDCDSNVVRCKVCKADVHYDNPCRHCFQDEGFEWRGAGVRPIDSEMMVPFHRLLSAMSEEFARDLKEAIKSGEFYTWLVAPLIGGGGHLSLYGMPIRNLSLEDPYGERIVEIGESERASEFRDGYRWLVSLYKKDTLKANRTTVAWIDQWLWPTTPFIERCGR